MAHHEEDSRSLQASRDYWRQSLTVCRKRLEASEAEKQQLLARVEELRQEVHSRSQAARSFPRTANGGDII